MGQSGHSVGKLQKFSMTNKMNMIIWSGCFIGFVTFVFGLQSNPARIWQAFLTNTFFFSSLAIGGLFFVAIQHVTKAGWSVTVRRVMESLTSFLPVALIAVVVVMFFGGKDLYRWLRPEEVASDELLQKKVKYLNQNFFVIRTLIFFGLWFLFAKCIVGNSLKQDSTGDEKLTHKNMPLSIGFLLIFAISYSLYSVDFVMSTDPHWFSTIFGVYTFAGLFQSTLAFAIIWIVYLHKQGILSGFVNENHMHDLGKFLFAFTVFYAYIAFSQFMLIWYANLPEETAFFLHRAHGGWMGVSFSLLIFKFIVPFLLLLPRAAKRNFGHLVRVSCLILVMQFVDLYWLIYPNFHKSPVFPIWEIGLFLGFLGLFVFTMTKFFAKNDLVPLKDPRLHEALNHHI